MEWLSSYHGHWARGWNEVLATWEEIGAVFAFYHGHDGRSEGIGTIHDLRIAVVGDVAYTIGVYKSHLYDMPDGVPGISVNCTNVLVRRDGVWKIVHHHPDQDPAFGASLARLVEAGQG